MGPLGQMIFAAAGTGVLPEPSSYQSIGWLIVGMGALALAINQVDDFIARRKDKPSAGEVAQEARERFMTREEFQATHEAIDGRIGTLEERVEQNRVLGDQSRRVLHEKIDELKTLLHAMETRVIERQNDMSEQLGAKISREIGDAHTRVNTVLENLAGLRGEVKQMNIRRTKHEESHT